MMLGVSVQVVVMLYLVEGISCLNLSTEASRVVDCFSETVNIPWQFPDAEYPRVLHFEHVTSNLCDRSLWRLFECNYSLMELYQDVKNLKTSYAREYKQFYNSGKLEDYENALRFHSNSQEVLERLIDLIRNIKLVADLRNETRILNDNCSRQFFDLDELKNISSEGTVLHARLQIRYEIFRLTSYSLWYYLPPFVTVVFICGMLGNGLLLVIFVRHPETRAGPNVMLINLAFSDTLFLFGNLALDYCKKLWGFPFGLATCYLYNFFLTVITGGSVYSMTMLSLSRYLAVTAKPGQRSNILFRSTPVMLAIVWIVSSIVAIPDTLNTVMPSIILNQCYADNRMLNALGDFLFISLVPLCVITWLYVATSRRLMKSARNMPGEALGQVKVKTARERGAKILPALAFVFAITYLPFYTLWAIVTGFAIDTNECPTCHRLFYLVYYLFNLNSTLNPVALYAASSMFRKYFNMYLCLQFLNKQTPQNNIQMITTGASKK